MPSHFEELIGRIAPAQLIGYTFEDRTLRFQLYHADSGRLYSFAVPTDTVHGRGVSEDPDRTTCSVALVELGRRLDIRHDRYFPPVDSKLLLADARDRVMIAYGRRSSDCRWLLSLRGEHPLLGCLVRDLGEVVWEVD